MSRRPHGLFPSLALLGIAAVASARPAAAELAVPYLSGRVNDTAGIIPQGDRAELEAKLERFEAETGSQVVVLTVPSLEGEPLEDYTLRVAETWKLGRKGVDDGVLFFVARDDRKLRIEVGYGLEPVLTDLDCKHILDGAVVPRFREGDFGGGVEAGVDAILGKLRGDPGSIPPPSRTSSAGMGSWLFRLVFLGMFALVVGTFSLAAVFGGGQGWFLWFFLMPFYLAFPGAALGWGFGAGALALWVVGFPLLRLWLSRTPSGKRFKAGHPRLTTFATSGGHGGGSWGGGGGGFSGGGGSFGGGGASSGW